MFTVGKCTGLKLSLLLGIIFAGSFTAFASSNQPQKVKDGVIIPIGNYYLKLEVCADNVIRVARAPDPSFFSRNSLAAGVRYDAKTAWAFNTGDGEGVLMTDKLIVKVDLGSGAVSFFNSDDDLILAEDKYGHNITPAIVQGDKTFHIRQQWLPNDGEALFGLGQHQLGLMNIKGYDLDLWQHNGTVAIPLLVSSHGYGIFWDNTSYTRFGDLREPETIPPLQLIDADGRSGGLTGSYFAGENFQRLVGKRVDSDIDIEITNGAPNANQMIFPDLPANGPVSVRWEGDIVPGETGDYMLETFFNNGLKVWVDGKLVISHWRQGWLPRSEE